MKIVRTLLAASLLYSCILGCASSPERAAENAARERAFQFSGGDELARRASFDLNCPPQEMQCQVLQRVGMFQIAVTAGVRGCGRQASFVRSAGTSGAWVLNGPVTEDPSMLQQPPQPQQQVPPAPPPAQ